MEKHKQPLKRDGENKKPPVASDGVPVMKSTNSRASKGCKNKIGARSKTMDVTKSSLSKSAQGSTSGDSLNPLTTKNKAQTKSDIKLNRTSKIKDTVSSVKTTSHKQELEKSILPSSAKSAHSGISFIPKKSVSHDASIFRFPQEASTKTDKATTLKKDLDVKLRTVSFNEEDLENTLMQSPSVKSSAHCGIIFTAKKKSPFSEKNIFNSSKDSSNDDQSPNSLNHPSVKPPVKTLHGLMIRSKDVTKESTEQKTGKKSVAPSKKVATAGIDKATPSKMLRSKTEAAISKNPRITKPIPRVQSFSRPKPESLLPKKPAHQAILDVTTLVKGDPKVKILPVTTAHSGVPFKPKKPSTFAGINIFARNKDGTSK